MKIRILDNSIRLRFSQTELTQLQTIGAIRKEVHFDGGTQFTYSLNTSDSDKELSADFTNNEMRVFISESKVKELVQTDLVGVENNDSGLKLLVEKDFKCLTERKEDETELFENPLKNNPNC
ncbi:MAG: hypothetical protein HKO56_06310 [Bacteroidia bacterium]|nr:hypothetical protein [Bacteroidia bacterium]NNM16253.1 hypothetical protein [Bacteroidia bacterium]